MAKRFWLASARVGKGMSQGDVAQAAKIAPITYFMIENGKTQFPKLSTAKAIAEVLGFDFMKFYEEEL